MANARFAVKAAGVLIGVMLAGQAMAREVEVHVNSSPDKKVSASSKRKVESGRLVIQGSDAAKRFGEAYLAGKFDVASKEAAGGDFKASSKMQVHVSQLSGFGGSLVESSYAWIHVTSVSSKSSSK